MSLRDLVRRALADARGLGRVYTSERVAAILPAVDRTGTTTELGASVEAAVVLASEVSIVGTGKTETAPNGTRVFTVIEDADAPWLVGAPSPTHTCSGIVEVLHSDALIVLEDGRAVVSEVAPGVSARDLQKRLGVPLAADERLSTLRIPPG